MEKLLWLPLALLLNCQSARQVPQNEQQDIMGSGNEQQQQAGQLPGVASATADQLQHQPQVVQGIAGRVVWQGGNQMPSPDAPPPANKRGVQRQVVVYELTNASQVTTAAGVFHSNFQSKLVTQIQTNADGTFAVSLKPGRYSLFSKEAKGLYANLFDGENNIFPIEVKQEEVTAIEFLISYEAVY